MWRKLILFSSLSFAVLTIDLRTASASVISKHNPHSMFNISGVNYASMKWEREHRGKVQQQGRKRRIFFRR